MATRTEQKKLGVQTRAASFTPATVDTEARTVDLVWTTGATVRRYDWWEGETYDEELVISDAAIRMGRLNGGAPLLADHDTWGGVRQQVGVVEKGWIEGAEGMCNVRFSKRDDVQPLYQDVVDGIVRNVSVGYKVHRYEVTSARDREAAGGPRVALYRAVDWEPMEVSLVCIPADAGAGVRADGARNRRAAEELYPVEVVVREDEVTTTEDTNNNRGGASPDQRKEKHMDEELKAAAEKAAAEKAAAERAAAETAKRAAEEAVKAERARAAEIRGRCRAAGMEDRADDLIERGLGLEDVSKELFAAMASRSKETGTVGVSSPARVLKDAAETRAAAIENALMHRAGISDKLDGAAVEWRNLSLPDIARQFLAERGDAVRGLSAAQVVDKAFQSRGTHSTSDFPQLMANIVGRTLRQAYEAAPQTWRPFTRVVEVPDFREVSRVQLSGAPALLPVGQSGEYIDGTFTDSAERYRITRFGRMIRITRELIVNDDLAALTRVPMMIGTAARNRESDLVWGLLTGSHIMGDNIELFHADHGNLVAAGSNITVDNVGAADALMGTQTAPDGTPMNLTARFLAVSPTRKLAAQKLVGEIKPENASAVNPYSQNLTLLVESRIKTAAGGDPWFLMASSAQVDTIEAAYLQGQQGVQTFVREEFDTDGTSVKARLEFGAKPIDHRGFVKNPGN